MRARCLLVDVLSNGYKPRSTKVLEHTVCMLRYIYGYNYLKKTKKKTKTKQKQTKIKEGLMESIVKR